MADDLEERVRLLEAEHIVTDLRLNEFEGWRRRDEPHIAELVNAATVAAEVRKALNERRSSEWSRWQKAAAAIAGAATLAGGLTSTLNAFGVL